MPHKLTLFFALTILSLFAASTRAGEPHLMSWTVGKIEREGIVFAPDSAPKSGGTPLLFVFHGHGGNMRAAARGMKYQEVWPEAVVVYLQGLPTATKVDPQGKLAGWQHLPGDNNDRDLKYFDIALASIRTKYPIDEKRTYATGFSNGGFFTYLLWDQRPNDFAAFAPCAGLPRTQLKLTTPKPAFIVAGKEDKLVSINDQRAAIKRICELDGAKPTGEREGTGVQTFSSEKGTPVEALIHPGGHILPPGATRQIVEFLKAQELKKASAAVPASK